ncbi:MAG: hypothetical protein E7200_08000 [Selenomonas ruminantium]|nr:hypothetical protein [Selenomonas ruminantium]
MNRKILLVEPNYKNKYPPMPLMKLASYYRRCNDDVRFYKGDLKNLAAELLCEQLYKELNDEFLAKYYDIMKKYIRIGKLSILEDIPFFDDDYVEIARKYRLRFMHKDFPKFDVIAITTLFTFYWAQTIDTINYCKFFKKENGKIYIGGIAATILPTHIEEETGIKPIVGLLDKPGILDKDNNDIIDELPLDYSILEEIDYTYPAHDAYFSYMTRGCIRQCKFCAVKIIEPNYKNYISIVHQLDYIDNKFGKQRDLLLMDNNVFASDQFNRIVDEIKDCGFQRGATYKPSSEYEITYNNIVDNYNLRAYLKKIIKIYDKISNKLSEQDAGKFYVLRENEGLLYTQTATREAVIDIDDVVRPLYNKYFKTLNRKRSIDFNQGIDARLVTNEKMKKLSEVAINPLRIAFDHYEQKDIYVKAVETAAQNNITHLSNYLLYNFHDKPEHLYYRMRINVDLCEKHNVTIYSFPMKYHPIDDPDYFRNRDYIGEHWNRKFIRAVQAVLNATKGKIGRGLSFFNEAFGEDIDGFFNILWMPEAFIISRFKYKDNLTKEWQEKFYSLSEEKLKIAKDVISVNNFDEEVISKFKSDNDIYEVLKYYQIKRDK